MFIDIHFNDGDLWFALLERDSVGLVIRSISPMVSPSLGAFADYYNNRRPHRALGRQTPMSVFKLGIKARPSLQPVPADHRVRRDKTDNTGNVTLRNMSRLRHIAVGTSFARSRLRLPVADADVRILAGDGSLIRQLTLDPKRVYQPLARTKICPRCRETGVHDVLRHDSGGKGGV